MVATVIVSAALAIGVAATAVAVIEEGSSEEESSEEESSEEASSEEESSEPLVQACASAHRRCMGRRCFELSFTGVWVPAVLCLV